MSVLFASVTGIAGWLPVLTLLALQAADAQQEQRFVPPSSNPEDLYTFGDHVYFSAQDGRYGRELWRVDYGGNAERVKDIEPGTEGSDPGDFCAFRKLVYFTAGAPGKERALWCTDGTTAGTRMAVRLSDLPGFDGTNLSGIVGHAGERMFLVSGDANRGRFFWASDGTPENTRQILKPGGAPISFSDFHGIVNQDEMYIGYKITTEIGGVARVRPGSHVVEELGNFEGGPTSFFAMPSGEVLFAASTPESGSELWIADDGNLELVKDIWPGAESSDVGEFHRFTWERQDIVLFVATTPENGREIWQTDGTPDGTKLWKEVAPGPTSANPYRLMSRDVNLYFSAIGEATGVELWLYKGDTDELILAGDINPGLASSHPYAFCLRSDGDLFFSATDGEGDEEWWECSPIEKSVRRIADINPGPSPSYPYYTVSLGDRVITVATSPVYGRELWVRRGDGTVELFSDIYTDSSVNPSSKPHSMTPAGELLYFVANDIEHGRELWASDGTEAGTRMVKDIFPGKASSEPDLLTPVGDLLYFVSDDGSHGFELWRSDGTTIGTIMLSEICIEGSARISTMVALNDSLIFGAYRALDGEELWIVEPGKRPRLLRDINDGPGSSEPRDLVVWKRHAYFRANDGIHGEELWRTDGTRDGTVMVKDVVNAPVEKISALEVGIASDRLFVAAEVDQRGVELWWLNTGHDTLELVRDIANNSAHDVLRTTP